MHNAQGRAAYSAYSKAPLILYSETPSLWAQSNFTTHLCKAYFSLFDPVTKFVKKKKINK